MQIVLTYELIVIWRYEKMMSRSEIQKRIDDLILELKRLRQENRDLKAENEILKARLTASEATIEAAEKTIEQVSAEVEAKTEELAKANEEIVRLNATINMDSSNSSRPPSQDGYRKPPRPIHNSREKSGRKRGGQSCSVRKGRPRYNI